MNEQGFDLNRDDLKIEECPPYVLDSAANEAKSDLSVGRQRSVHVLPGIAVPDIDVDLRWGKVDRFPQDGWRQSRQVCVQIADCVSRGVGSPRPQNIGNCTGTSLPICCWRDSQDIVIRRAQGQD